MTTTQALCVLADDRPQGKLQEQDEEAFLMRQEVRRRLHRDVGKRNTGGSRLSCQMVGGEWSGQSSTTYLLERLNQSVRTPRGA